MRIPIRNKGSVPLTIFIEPVCDHYDVPVGAEAIVRLEDGCPHSIDIFDDHIRVWDEGSDSSVEIVTAEQQSLFHALSLVRVWLPRLGLGESASAVEESVDGLETRAGYLNAHALVFGAFYFGFQTKEAQRNPVDGLLPAWAGSASLTRAYDAGGAAAYSNLLARRDASFPGPGLGPLDTETVRTAFSQSLEVVGDLANQGSH
ncbi:MAG TPA: hypothetical protein VI168_11010 [Croceibacterium sp.]